MTNEPTADTFDDWRKRLWDEIAGLHDAREQYLALFGQSQEQVEMLNACARWFFGLVQRTLLREVILGISRLTDPAEVRGRTNLVLGSLLLDPGLATRPEVTAELTAAIAAAVTAAQPIRLHRHKYIAHLDHAVATGDADALLPSLTKAQVDDAVARIEEAYNLHGSRMRASFAYFSVGTTGGAPALVAILAASERWRLTREIRGEKEGGEPAAGPGAV